jgi:3-oxoadipate enol-lactonase
MAFTRINGRVLHWRLAGRSDRPVVAFSNSLGSDFRIWDEVVAALADRWQILLYDKVGHGLSDLPDGAYAIDDHTDDLIGLLDHIGAHRAAIVGLSVGGMIAQRLAVRQPERVSALVLCDTAAKIGTAETWAARIAAVESGGIASIADVVLERWFTKAFRQIWPNELRGWRNMLVRSPVEGYVATCAAIRDADLTSEAAKIRVPTLCVVGDEDGSTPPDVVEATARLIPSARFQIIEGAGHLPCIEKPAVLAGLIENHLAEAGHG